MCNEGNADVSSALIECFTAFNGVVTPLIQPPHMLGAVIAHHRRRLLGLFALVLVMVALVPPSSGAAQDLPPADDVIEQLLDAADVTKSQIDFAGWMASPLPGLPKTTFLQSRRPVPPAILPQTISILTPLRC